MMRVTACLHEKRDLGCELGQNCNAYEITLSPIAAPEIIGVELSQSAKERKQIFNAVAAAFLGSLLLLLKLDKSMRVRGLPFSCDPSSYTLSVYYVEK